MYCYHCDRFFDESELVQQRDPSVGYHVYVCPYCGSDDLGESDTCVSCDEDFIEGEISNGYCLECLRNAITYDLAFQYMNDKNCLAEFMLEYWFETGKLESSSMKFDLFLSFLYQQLEDEDAQRIRGGHKALFYEACVEFCLPNHESGNFSAEAQQFAEWYANKQKGDNK